MTWRAVRRLFETIIVSLVLFAAVALTYNYFVHYQSRLEAWPLRSDFVPPAQWSPDNPDRIRILSLDGGGMHGLITLEILKDLENTSGRPIAELFDFVAGTSTGAIIGALLLLPGENGKPKHSASDVIEIYRELSKQIFTVPLYHRVLTLDGMLGPRFHNHAKFVASSDVFSGHRFGQLLRPMMVPTYSRKRSDLHLFINVRDPDANLKLGPLIAAATSAPGMFPGVELLGHGDYGGMYNDGGLLLNNPAHRAFQYVFKSEPRAQIVVVSVGATMTVVVPPDIDTSGGMAEWLMPMYSMAGQGQSEISTWSLETLEDASSVVKLESYRLDPHLQGVFGLFDASDSNMEHLEEIGRDYVASNRAEIGQIIDDLTGTGGELTLN